MAGVYEWDSQAKIGGRYLTSPSANRSRPFPLAPLQEEDVPPVKFIDILGASIHISIFDISLYFAMDI